MTGPIHGSGSEPPPTWPEGYAAYREDPGYDEEPAFPEVSPPQPPRRSRRMLVGTILIGMLALALAVALAWQTLGPHRDDGPVGAAVGGAPSVQQGAMPTSAVGSGSSAYDVGTCLYEQPGGAPGAAQLEPVSCAGSQAVFMVNQVVTNPSACDANSGADYRQHGGEVPDTTANVTYCVSLVVPPNQCFVHSGTFERVACGSAPDAVRVLAVEPAPTAQAACGDKPDPDVWFYQSPNSGQYACVSWPAGRSGPVSPPPSPTR